MPGGCPPLARSFLVLARPRKPWFRKERNAWFVEIDGRQVPLGEHPAAFPRPSKLNPAGTRRRRSSPPTGG
jgi:hypothetical protein